MKTFPSPFPKEIPMTLPSNVRSLIACGAFCAVGGAWLTLVTEIRTLPLRPDTNVASAAPAPFSEAIDPRWTRVENATLETPPANEE
jgi:hypothetical protein